MCIHVWSIDHTQSSTWNSSCKNMKPHNFWDRQVYNSTNSNLTIVYPIWSLVCITLRSLSNLNYFQYSTWSLIISWKGKSIILQTVTSQLCSHLWFISEGQNILESEFKLWKLELQPLYKAYTTWMQIIPWTNIWSGKYN